MCIRDRYQRRVHGEIQQYRYLSQSMRTQVFFAVILIAILGLSETKSLRAEDKVGLFSRIKNFFGFTSDPPTGFEYINTPDAPAPMGPYSQGVILPEYARLVYPAGQIGVDPKVSPTNAPTIQITPYIPSQTGTLVSDDAVEQARQALNNVKAILTAGNSGLEHVFKATVYLADINDFARVNTEYAKFFPMNPPARVCFAVASLPKNAKVEIEVIATTKDRSQIRTCYPQQQKYLLNKPHQAL
eukprot:TRINITY_DN2056_c0_g1_i12.p1 TRINITY_DN2056_c0_g1~~TRINITY_DN2056_c0_g1_i12.p1  ORF type:complete len:243 (+),score=45.25 TRINITY_DN2056_c0_g1_i12:66-794(+)